MAKLKKGSQTAMITNEVRFSYASVFVAREGMNGGDPKFGTTILIKKDDTETLDLIKACIKTAIDENLDKLKLKKGQTLPSSFKTSLRDGDADKPDNPEYENCMFINTSSKRAPGVVKKEDGKAIPIGEDEFYSGCYGKVSINFFAYNVDGGKGIACGLNNVMKTRDGDRLSGGGYSAAEDFELDEPEDGDFM